MEGKSCKCSCKIFEFKDIIFMDVLLVWEYEEVTGILSEYIVDRWRKEKFRRVSIVKIPNYQHTFLRSDKVKQFDKIHFGKHEVADMAMTDDGICKDVMDVEAFQAQARLVSHPYLCPSFHLHRNLHYTQY